MSILNPRHNQTCKNPDHTRYTLNPLKERIFNAKATFSEDPIMLVLLYAFIIHSTGDITAR